MRTIIATEKAPAAIGPYSQANKFGNLVITSGQLPIDMATGAFPEIDEFGMKSDRVKVPLHDFRCGRNTRTVGRTAVAVDEFGEILQVAFEHFC